ncbi:peptidoglycan DD-metalloendopeptidase family protein [Rhodococcus hoagii]|nr:peptidoglycan DD-metalloendopeptidase family protein [Prescottella equi]
MKTSKAGIGGVIGVLLLVLSLIVIVLMPSDPANDCAPGSALPGVSLPAGTKVKPMKAGTYQLTSGFGARWGTQHKGQDLAGPVDNPIYATADGIVSAAGPASGFGQWIIIDHNVDGRVFSSVYGHMNDNGVLVKVGDQVRAGQHIANEGYNGEVSPPGPGGAHLHFEIWDGGHSGGQAIDPTQWLSEAVEPDGSGASAGTPKPAAPPVPRGAELAALPASVGSESHWQVDTIKVARSVHAQFPEVKAIGGWRPKDDFPDHPSGRAADIMIPDYDTGAGKELGDRIAQYVMANKDTFNVEYIIWRQQYIPADGQSNIMEDRGGPTANHYDHVHVTTRGGGMPNADTAFGAAPGAAGGNALPVACRTGVNVEGGDNLSPGKVPAEFEPWLKKAGAMCPQISSSLLAAQINQESSFNPNAVSKDGAMGAGQFMPGTWPGYGRDDDGNGQASPFDIGDAVMAQGRYMCELAGQVDAGISDGSIKAPNGPVELYLAGYNAGIGAVQRSGGFPTGHSDYEVQTRPYTQKIQAAAHQYALAG